METHSYLVTDIQSLRQQLIVPPNTAKSHVLVQLFSTQSKQEALDYSHLLSQRFPEATIIGQSTSHVIHRGEIETEGTLITLSLFEHSTLSFAATVFSDNHIKDGKQLRSSLAINENTKAVISFADGIDSGSPLYRDFELSIPSVAVSGGISANNKYGSWVLLNLQTYNDAAIAAAIHGEQLHTWQGCFSEWNPIGCRLNITQAQENRVSSLNGQTTHQVYSRYLNDGNPVQFSELKNFPLISGTDSSRKIAFPTELLSDGSIAFSESFNEGDDVRFSYNHPALTLEQVRIEAAKLRGYQPDVIFTYSCNSRLRLMQGNEELIPLQSLSPTFGSYCSGELWRDAKQQHILHHSMTYLALREGDAKELLSEDQASIPHCRNTFSPLFSLVRNAISDVDAMQSNMEKRLTEKSLELEHLYHIDRRTGLKNRLSLKQRMKRMHLNEHLITMKLTNFPQINEKYGYHIGDQLLTDISHYFETQLIIAFGESSQLYCTGIGEWACLFKSESASAPLKQRLYDFTVQLEQVNFEPEDIPAQDRLTVSICAGIISRRDYPDIPADKVLFKGIEARRFARKDNRHVYSAKQVETKKESQQSQLSWLSCVSRAILDNNVLTFAQPIVKASSHKQVSVECLVRIQEGGQILYPGQFLPAIEGTHLYTRLSRCMIENTFTLMRDRKEDFSINLSPQDLMNDKTIQLLERYLLTLGDSSRVGFEVLESERMNDYGRMLEVCNHLRAFGARIIVDDLGSGYSNIDEIIKLEPQIVKLDGSLIKTIDKDPRQRKVAKTMVQLCKVFGAKTVAEFVHNQEVCRIAEDMGIDYLQGYYLAEPYQLQPKG